MMKDVTSVNAMRKVFRTKFMVKENFKRSRNHVWIITHFKSKTNNSSSFNRSSVKRHFNCASNDSEFDASVRTPKMIRGMFSAKPYTSPPVTRIHDNVRPCFILIRNVSYYDIYTYSTFKNFSQTMTSMTFFSTFYNLIRLNWWPQHNQSPGVT